MATATGERHKQQLALEGGLKAVSGFEGRGEPKIGVDEFMAVVERFGLSTQARKEIRAIAESESWGGGPFMAHYYSGLKEAKVEEFERVAREFFGAPYALGVASGTAALHAAFVAAGVGPGTEVVLPAIGFFATAAAVVAAGGVPVFCDVDESLGMDPAKIENCLTDRAVALAPTHVQGSVCDMGAIMKIARRRKLRVVEDCAQSCGGRFKDRLVGTFGDLGCFSISAYKIVGGGEGGLVLARTKRLWERANQLAECGGLWRENRFGPPRYPGELFCGTNYRMSEMEAAVDAVQLRKTPATVRRFQRVRKRVVKRLRSFAEITPQKANDASGEVGYSLRFFAESPDMAWRIARALGAEGVSAGARGPKPHPDWHIYHEMLPLTHRAGHTEANCPYECPIYLERGGRAVYEKGQCPVADELYERAVSVRLNQWWTAGDCRQLAAAVNKVLAAYCTPSGDAPPWPLARSGK